MTLLTSFRRVSAPPPDTSADGSWPCRWPLGPSPPAGPPAPPPPRPRMGGGPGPVAVAHAPTFVGPPARRPPRLTPLHDLTFTRPRDLCTADPLGSPPLLRRAIREGAWVHAV